MDYINDLHELCETIAKTIKETNEKIRSAGGKLTGSDVDFVDKLTHAMKSVKATIAMMEDEDGYSGYYPVWRGAYADGTMNGNANRGSYNRGSYRGSYARGRNARRDSMGRYSGEQGYSRDGGMVEELRGLMEDAPDERTRQEFQRFISKIENM